MKYVFYLIVGFSLMACKDSSLPYLGEPDLVNGEKVYPTIPDFEMMNQDSQMVSQQTLTNKIYVADFIFLSCPTICPVMTKEMYRVYEKFEQDDRVVLLSHTIDPVRDSIPRLKKYADGLGVATNKWHFLRGDQDQVFQLAEESYFSTALPDSTAPGGFVHSGGLLLIDTKKHIRGVYNGTSPNETERLIKDIQVLLKESF